MNPKKNSTKKKSRNSFNYNKARHFLMQKEESRARKIDELYKRACSDFETIISMLKEKYNLKRIYQWGSLLDKKRFSDISDIDIAVEGVRSADEFFRMYGEAEKLTQFSLDLVEIEKIDPLHADSIKKYGKVVYEEN